VKYLIFLLVALAALTLPSFAYAVVTIRVGEGAGCGTNNVQTAINMAPPPPEITQILIARNHGPYFVNSLIINNKNVILYGGYVDCNQVQFDGIRTEISGAGGAAASVIIVRGASTQVGFYNLAISGGDENDSSYGGGVDILEGPHTNVVFQNSSVFNNVAGLGGGISIRNNNPADQASVFVQILSNNIIADNSSLAGGGIYCENSTLHIKGLNTTIKTNLAGRLSPRVLGNGGGMNLQNCITKIGTTSIFGTVSDNYATNSGGGILAAKAGTKVDIYNVDANGPTRLVRNSAESYGGAIAIDDDADVTVYDGIIEANRAYLGGGAVNVFDEGSDDAAIFKMLKGDQVGNPAFFDQRVRCEPAIAETCNRLSNNTARSFSGEAASGSAIRTSAAGIVDGVAGFRLEGVKLDRNLGGSLVSFTSGFRFNQSYLIGCLVVGNTSDGPLFYARPDLYIKSSTIASNLVNGAILGIDPDGASRIFSNIVKEIEPFVAEEFFDSRMFGLNILSSVVNIPPQFPETNLVANPLFVDEANGNYRLAFGSSALDFVSNAPEDVNRNYFEAVRVVDLPNIVNRFGAQDAGAYEMASVTQPVDALFRSGFE
jgi:hypothetical protein